MILLLTQLFSLNFSKVLPLLQRDTHFFVFWCFFPKRYKNFFKIIIF